MGYIGYKDTSGVLFDHLDTRGQQEGIILLENAEQAHGDVLQTLGDARKNGKPAGKDGEVRHLNRHLFVYTSSQGHSIIYPKDSENWTDIERKSHRASQTRERLKSSFREKTETHSQAATISDEFLATIDTYTAADPTNLDKVKDLTFRAVQRITQDLESLHGITISFNKEVASTIAEVTYEKGGGIEPVENAAINLVEKSIEDYLVKFANQPPKGPLEISLHTTKTQKHIEVKELNPPPNKSFGPRRGKRTRTLIPEKLLVDPLNDRRFLGRIRKLGQELRKRIFGQETMISRLEQVVVAHESNKFSTQQKRLPIVLLLGPSGGGKTETGKALSMALYGRPDRYRLLSLGEITNELDFDNFFGIYSRDRKGRLQKILDAYPEGCVFILDEFTNMGGENKAAKATLMKRFYGLFEEGEMTFPFDGKTYSLSKYFGLATSNALEEFFWNIPYDDIRLLVWKKINSLPKIIKLLSEKLGIPEAILGRLSDIILMKPTLSHEVPRITRKILNETPSTLQRSRNKYSIPNWLCGKSFRPVLHSQPRGTICSKCHRISTPICYF